MAKRKRTKGQTIIYKTLHITLKIDKLEPHQTPELNSGATEVYSFPAPLVAPVVVLWLYTRWVVSFSALTWLIRYIYFLKFTVLK